MMIVVNNFTLSNKLINCQQKSFTLKLLFCIFGIERVIIQHYYIFVSFFLRLSLNIG